MTIRKKQHGSPKKNPSNSKTKNRKKASELNPKTGKKYSTAFKKRTVQYYLLGLYDESAIWKKYQVNRNLLVKWRKWYYQMFESPYATINKKNKSVKDGREKQSRNGAENESSKSRIESNQGSSTETKNENEKYRTSIGYSRSRSQDSRKKKWTEGVKSMQKEYPQSSVEELCALYGKTRQAWYKSQRVKIQNDYKADLIEEEVKRLRKFSSRMGGRKLYSKIQPFLKKENIKIGRDKFFDVLRSRNLLVKKKKNKRKTTNSNHAFRKYPNQTKDFKIENLNRANQLWVSDITYVSFGGTFSYLSLVMDVYSRKIVGYHISESLKAEGTIKALEKAIATLSPDERNNLENKRKKLIHHSDRGTQYCCNAYIKLLKQNHIEISMTENGDPYENIYAERINRTIKEEYLETPDYFMSSDFKEMKSATKRAVWYYNSFRPHASLNYLTPNQAAKMEGPLKKRWKNYAAIKRKKLEAVEKLKKQ